ncbi:MAG: lipopolysaccharide assembly protein LapA domain-containing protein [Gemmatimonas sp.]
MRLALWLLLLAIIVASMVFAVSNAGPVTLRFWPFPSSWDAPLFAIVAAAVIAGLLIGIFYGWLLGGPTRKRARALARENRALTAEIEDLRAQQTHALHGPESEDMD